LFFAQKTHEITKKKIDIKIKNGECKILKRGMRNKRQNIAKQKKLDLSI